MDHFSSPAIVCRPALPKDCADVLELTKQIWDGHDYLPQVWSRWLEDPLGLLGVAEYGGRVVGTVKLTLLAPGQWWLEGLRVHPEFEGRGFASHLHEYALDFWQRHGEGTLRLATASHRLKVHHLCERSGFIKKTELSSFLASALNGPAPGFLEVKADEVEETWALMRGSPTLAQAAGLMDLGWQWAEPTAQLLRVAASAGHAWWWRDRQGLLLASEDTTDEGEQLALLQLVACSAADLVELLLDYRRLAGSLGYSQASWTAPLASDLLTALAAAGFERSWPEAIFIFEKARAG
jgi:GNAT superfamily N-acetyltransferase